MSLNFSYGLQLFRVIAMFLLLPFTATADMISKEAQAHIACYGILDVLFDDYEPARPNTLARQWLEHERKYIEIGLDDLKNRQDGWVRNGLLYRLGKYAEYAERVQRERIYCDDPDVHECPAGELKWNTVEQIDRAALQEYDRQNCKLLLQ